MYYSRLKQLSIALVFPVLVASCVNQPHNDVLIFGTNTKVAFDISADPANAGTPSFTLGYKRQELALVPLKANGTLLKEGETIGDTAVGRKYIGEDGTNRKDAYSVFASFGSEFSSGTGNKAALSQFFATGIAAQNLGKNNSASSMVSVQPTDAKIIEKQEKISALQKSLGEEKVKQIKLERTKIVSDRKAKAAVIVMKVVKNDGSIDKTILNKAIKDGEVKAPWDTEIPKRTKAKDLNNYLVRHVVGVVVSSLYAQLK
jgi:hypothetical protein